MRNRSLRRAAGRPDDPRGRRVHAGERRRRLRDGPALSGDQRTRGPTGLHGRRADDAGLQARARQVRRRDVQRWRRGLRLTAARLTLGAAAPWLRRHGRAGRLGGTRGGRRASRAPRGPHRVLSIRTRSRRRAAISPTTPSPGRCAGSLTPGCCTTRPTASASGRFGSGRYVLTLPPERLRPRHRSGASVPVEAAREDAASGLQAASSSPSSRKPEAVRMSPFVSHRPVPDFPSRICTMVREAARASRRRCRPC